MSKRMFELVDGTSRKFWEVWVDGGSVCTRYGRIGSAGQTTLKEEGDAARAQRLCEKLVAEKTRKGYVEVVTSADPAAASVSATPLQSAGAAPAPVDTAAAAGGSARVVAPAKVAVGRKPLKAPKKSSAEYQALARGWSDLMSALGGEAISAAEFGAALDRLLADEASAAVADAERVLAQIAAYELRDPVSTPEEVTRLFKDDPPEELAAAIARNDAAIERRRVRSFAKHQALLRLLEAGCDPTKSAKGEERTPLEAFVFSLPLASQPGYASFPWSGGEWSAERVLEGFATAGDDGRGGSALGEAAVFRWAAFDWLLDQHPTPDALLNAWRCVVGQLGANAPADLGPTVSRLPGLAAQLRQHGADGLCFGDGPGALSVALTRGALAAVTALRTAGADLDAPAPRRVVCTVQVPTQLLPGGHNGVRQWQRLAFAAGLTGRDVAESTLDAYDTWEAFLGDREGTTFGSLGAARRRDHAEVRGLVAALVAEGCAASGRRRPRTVVAGEVIPAGYKAAVDAALVGCVTRLGGDGARATAQLAALDPGAFGALAYLRDAGAAVWQLLPEEQLPRVGAAWLKETLGVGDSVVGPDPSDLADFPPEAKAVLKSGAWLATRGSDVVVLEPSGRVVEATVRYGVVELAPDLAAFVTKDLGTITSA